MLFTREDWKLFRNIETLSQKAGVEKNRLPLLVIKELIDNALDVSDTCNVELHDGSVYIADNGPGIDPELLPVLYSINRPLVSSKLLRKPSRGALGNGLRVVMGGVIAMGGSLFINTRGGRYALKPQLDGTTVAEKIGNYDGDGTIVVVYLNNPTFQENDLVWGKNAIALHQGETYKGKTSAFWYTSEAFFELLNSSGTDLGTLLSHFEGVTKKHILEITNKIGNPLTNTLEFEASEKILGVLRDLSYDVKPKRLGFVGNGIKGDYYKSYQTLIMYTSRGSFDAQIPYVLEMWIDKDGEPAFIVSVNKTPITGTIRVYDDKKSMTVFGCGLHMEIKGKPRKIAVNIQIPYMPITSDGKAPDFSDMAEELKAMAERGLKKLNKQNTSNLMEYNERIVIEENLYTAIQKTSGQGQYKFSQRQLYYAVRPYVITAFNKELDYNYFCRVITKYEADNGPITGMYRDPRGVLYHPHTGEEIPIGTLSVESYERPQWTFNKIIYSEKEGFFSILKDTKFPERHDCALLTSKGFASRAVKDLFDLLGDTDEEILFFCIHDADSAGTKIYETLQEDTLARPGRRVKIINLGLDPWEALKMGLEVETFQSKTKRPVAQYVKNYTENNYFDDHTDWEEWLQSNRVELNAMTSPQFLNWLENKMSDYSGGKLIPSNEVIDRTFESKLKDLIRKGITQSILEKSNIEERIAKAMEFMEPEVKQKYGNLENTLSDKIEAEQEKHWETILHEMALDVVKDNM